MKFLDSWKCKFFRFFNFTTFFINFKFSLWANFGCMSNSSNGGSEKMPFLSWEWRAAINFSVQVSCELILNARSNLNTFRWGLWKLNPIIKKAISYPVNEGIYTFISFFLNWVCWFLLCVVKGSLNNPVIFTSSVDFTKETKSSSSTINR